MKGKLDEAGIVEQDGPLCAAAGHAFCNTSRFTIRDLKARANQQQLLADFKVYLDGFLPNVQDILEHFEFRNQVLRLSKADAWHVESSVKIGYEISFTRHFYRPQPMRSLDDIRADILILERETEGLLDEVIVV